MSTFSLCILHHSVVRDVYRAMSKRCNVAIPLASLGPYMLHRAARGLRVKSLDDNPRISTLALCSAWRQLLGGATHAQLRELLVE